MHRSPRPAPPGATRTQYGPDAEVWARIGVLPGDKQPHPPARHACSASAPRPTTATCCARTSSPERTRSALERIDNGAFVNRLTLNQELAVGDTLLLRVKGSTLEAWRNDGARPGRGSVSSTDTTYAGRRLRRDRAARHDRPSRRLRCAQPEPERRPARPPASPRSRATRAASLSWSAPIFDGGSALTGYRVYRGTSAGGESFLQSAGQRRRASSTPASRTARPTTTRCPPRTRNGEGAALERGHRRHPPTLVAPVEPLPVVDDFDRAVREPALRRRPLVERVNGSARDRPLRHRRTQLACSKSTTCTVLAQRSAVRPRRRGRGRASRRSRATTTHIRLYVRAAAAAAASTYDGYMLRTNQLAGTDQIYLERIDNGAFVNRADDQPGARRRRHPPPARRGVDARGLAQRRLGLVAARCRHGRDLRGCRASSASGCAARSGVSTTSVRARWARRRPTPSRRARRAP